MNPFLFCFWLAMEKIDAVSGLFMLSNQKYFLFSYPVLCIEIYPFTNSCCPHVYYMYMRRKNTVAVKTNAFM